MTKPPRRGHHRRHSGNPGVVPAGLPPVKPAPRTPRDRERAWRGHTPEDRLVQLPATLPAAPEPVYVRLAGVLAEAVAGGVFTRGDLLPRVGALARRYHCSGPPVRVAISLLVENGVVHRLPGGKVMVN